MGIDLWIPAPCPSSAVKGDLGSASAVDAMLEIKSEFFDEKRRKNAPSYINDMDRKSCRRLARRCADPYAHNRICRLDANARKENGLPSTPIAMSRIRKTLYVLVSYIIVGGASAFGRAESYPRRCTKKGGGVAVVNFVNFALKRASCRRAWQSLEDEERSGLYPDSVVAGVGR